VLLRGALQHHILFRASIHNPTLNDCTLIECTIYGSKIRGSQVKDCRVRKKALGIISETASTPCIWNCQVESGTIYNADTFDSTFNGTLLIQSCNIESGLAVSSLIFDSTLINCGAHESEPRFGEVFGGALTESVTQSKAVSYREPPIDIRKMTYSNAIAVGGLTTNLIAVLRRDYLLYSEVLESLFAEHEVVFSDENRKAISSMSKTTT